MEDFSFYKEAGGALWRPAGVNPMRHGVSEQQWLDYMDNTLETTEHNRIAEHLHACLECQGTYCQLRAWSKAIQREAMRLRDSIELPEAEIDRLLVQALERIRTLGPSRRNTWSVPEGLAFLRALLTPFCGVGTARAFMKVAARKSCTADATQIAECEEIAEENWCLFLANLSETVSLQCGLTTGRLVSHAGLSVRIHES